MAAPMHILIAEDEPDMVEALTLSLRFQWPDCEFAIAATGAEALQLASERNCNLVLLDIGLPVVNGYDVLRDLRRASTVPIIVVSGRKNELDRVRALELGADDFVSKPFGHMELLARVKAVLRRAVQSNGTESVSYYDGYLGLDFATRRVTIADQALYLTPHEYGLLQQLVSNAGNTIPHDVLLSKTWGAEGERGVLRVYIRRLREKIEHNPTDPRYLLTDRSVGYRFQPSPFARR